MLGWVSLSDNVHQSVVACLLPTCLSYIVQLDVKDLTIIDQIERSNSGSMRDDFINVGHLGRTGGHVAQKVCHMVMIGWYVGDCDIIGEDALHSPQGFVGG